MLEPMNESFTISLPVPGGLLSPNYKPASHGSRMAQAAALKKYKRLSREAVEEVRLDSIPWEKCTTKAAFYYYSRRKRDPDNATGSLKAAYDGIVAAGVVPDDDWEHMEREKPLCGYDPFYPRVEITVERIS